MPVVAKRITRDEVYCADEAFFTGTAAEVTPIRELDNRAIGSGKRGPVTEKLQKTFFDCVHGQVGQVPRLADAGRRHELGNGPLPEIVRSLPVPRTPDTISYG